MDTGAQQDVPDTGANASGAGTAENAGVSNKSAGIDKGKSPEVPEIRTEPASTAPGQATSAAPEKSASQTLAPEKTASAPAKTNTPTTSPAPAPAKAAPTFKMTQIVKEKRVTPPASSAMTLHTSKGAARVSSFHTPELDGRVSLRTKSDNSLGSLKDYYMKWNDADFVDTTSSSKKKALAGTQTAATGNPPAIPAKPVAIASELFSIQQRLYRLSEASTVSIHPYISPVPENAGCPEYGHPGFSNTFFNLAEFQIHHISSIRASNPSH
jgi:hypothetical protein